MKEKITLIMAIEITICMIAQDLIRKRHAQKDIDDFVNQFKLMKLEDEA